MKDSTVFSNMKFGKRVRYFHMHAQHVALKETASWEHAAALTLHRNMHAHTAALTL